MLIQPKLSDLYLEGGWQSRYWDELSCHPIWVSASTRHQKPPLLDHNDDTAAQIISEVQSHRGGHEPEMRDVRIVIDIPG